MTLCFYFPDAPSNVGDLDLQPSLSLEWSRPSDPPFTEVNTNYTVEINATEEDGMSFRNFTSDTSLSVQFLEDMLQRLGSDCVEFEFSVSATNDAGTGPLRTIKDTVPICKSMKDIHNNTQDIVCFVLDVFVLIAINTLSYLLLLHCAFHLLGKN